MVTTIDKLSQRRYSVNENILGRGKDKDIAAAFAFVPATLYLSQE